MYQVSYYVPIGETFETYQNSIYIKYLTLRPCLNIIIAKCYQYIPIPLCAKSPHYYIATITTL